MRLRNEDMAFSTTSYVFTRMQVLIWIANGTTCLDLLEKDAGTLLSTLIYEYETDKPIVVSFKNITEIDDHALDDVFKVLDGNKRQLLILNGYHLLGTINKLKKESKATFRTDSINEVIAIGGNLEYDINLLNKEREAVETRYLKDVIKGTYQPFKKEKRLPSTPIISDGEFDSNVIISNPRSFIWITAFLSDLLKQLLDKTTLKKVKLLSASLRSAPFASMLGIMHNLEYEIIDHFGPKHKVFEPDFVGQTEKDVSYIYIGDYCLAGTEIKIATAYTEFKQSKLKHAIVIGNLIDATVFKENFELLSLISLTNLGIKPNYKII